MSERVGNSEGPELTRRGALTGFVTGGAVAWAAPRAFAAPASTSAIEALRTKFTELKLAALSISQHGREVLAMGDLAKPYLLHSMRKSLISMLYGIAAQRGEIDINATLGSLGVDDDPKLTDEEKKATVKDLLKACSGIYIPAAAESPAMKARRPQRGSHPAGTFWYYNNWDFNALGHIYEAITAKSVFIAFDHYIAKPLGFQDYELFDDTFYQYEPGVSRFPAYVFELSTRDLARMGQMLIAGGKWNGTQIVPADWLAQSTQAYSRTNFQGALSGYGYLWWIASEDKDPVPLPRDAFTAAGAGGHFLTVIRSLDLVVVVRVNTFDENLQSPVASPDVYSAFLRQIVAALS